MPPRPEQPRIPPLSADELTDQARELLGADRPISGPASNIFATLVRHPGLYRKWFPFGGKILFGKLPARDRELLILRTGWHCRSPYEWGQHVLMARECGVSDEDIARVPLGPDAEGWGGFDRLLLRAADQLHADAGLSDDVWAGLARQYDEAQLIEVPMLVGHYHMVAFTLNTLGVQREAGVPDLPPG